MKITFAKQDPIVVHCRDGQVVVTVSLARLSKASAGRKWTNFQVQACYRPRANGRSVELVRDGVIHFPSGGANWRCAVCSPASSPKTPPGSSCRADRRRSAVRRHGHYATGGRRRLDRHLR